MLENDCLVRMISFDCKVFKEWEFEIVMLVEKEIKNYFQFVISSGVKCNEDDS